MRCTGVLKDAGIDLHTGKIKLEIQLNDDVREHIDSLMQCEKLSVELKKYREGRSLDANAYAWVLMSKIASAVGNSKEEIYEEMLRRYGVLYEDEDGHITVTLKSTVDISRLDGHWLKLRSNGEYTGYAMIKGSSEYDTKEMSDFIDGIISECHELGIQTMTPNEVEKIKQKWGVDVGKTADKHSDE